MHNRRRGLEVTLCSSCSSIHQFYSPQTSSTTTGTSPEIGNLTTAPAPPLSSNATYLINQVSFDPFAVQYERMAGWWQRR
jgi:hypothetical protein